MDDGSRLWTRAQTALAAGLLALAPPAGAKAASGASPANACVARFAAAYAVRHMEMGGGILLRPDGTFLYQLSYGALDEEARGRWTCDADTVFLTSDPVAPPRFVTLGVAPAAPGQVHVTLDLPKGMSRQYFSVLVRKADGTAEQRDFDEEGLMIEFSNEARPVSIQPLLEVYALAGDAIPLPSTGDGYTVNLRFDPNDLGKVAFERTPMKGEGRTLRLARFGEMIAFQVAGG